MAMNSSWRKHILSVPCPRCRRRNGHWCRDDKGKALAVAHRERSQAAISDIASVLGVRKVAAR